MDARADTRAASARFGHQGDVRGNMSERLLVKEVERVETVVPEH